MPISLRQLDICQREAERFLKTVAAATDHLQAEKLDYDTTARNGAPEIAAVRVASIHLTRVLSDLRSLR
jgi:hypothetical protein